MFQGHALQAGVYAVTQEELEAAGAAAGEFYAPGWSWNPATVPAWAIGVISAAVSDIGKTEVGSSNDGPDIAKLHTHGRPWCALWLSEIFREGLIDAGGCPWGIIASAHGIYMWALKHGKMMPAHAAQSGDCFIILRPVDDHGEIHGHVGLIAHVDGDHVFTVEGNSGQAVRGGRRAISSFTAVARPIDDDSAKNIA
jgi:hypothetical protein